MASPDSLPPDAIAIVGLACRVPGAQTPEAFWKNLAGGVESFTELTDEQLTAAGVPEALFRDPRYVRRRPTIEGAGLFDAAFFGMTPREAEVLDPQQRLFLECAWEALESACCDPTRATGPVGVFGGVFMSTYLLNLLSRPDVLEAVGDVAARHGNDKDYLATRVSFKFDLRGPSLAVGTSCSTSLVATHLACQSLLARECDTALAGGVSITFPQHAGYLYQEGDVLSPDGRCRAFDAGAAGTVFGDGAGVVVLRRLEDALRDGQPVRAVILGSAINNDGSSKVGYTAPSVDGQAAVITEALAVAGVSADSISYVETHGTGTSLGDPIEIAALTRAFQATTRRRGYCAIGSVKTNVGHLATAAGVTGLIKAVLSLEARQLAPSLHFRSPNPLIDFAATPFRVNTALTEWSCEGPRRAGVSSFGMGGTNAHVVLQEAPRRPAGAAAATPQVFTLSAKTPEALQAAAAQLADHVERSPATPIAAAALTLQLGRQHFPHRRAMVAQDAAELSAQLREQATGTAALPGRQVAFLFPGQGAQHPGMARGLYETEPVFRAEVDACLAALKRRAQLDLRGPLFGGSEDQLRNTELAQPALFVIEHALAQLWRAWGVAPAAMLGHSVGELVAACQAGVLERDDALELVAARGRLAQRMEPGAMLAVSLSAPELAALLGGAQDVELAAENGPSQCVLSGPTVAIARVKEQLAALGHSAQVLRTSHAFHSAMMEPAVGPLTDLVAKLPLRAPKSPFLSNVTGTWATAEEVTSPAYWGRHLRGTVRFSQGAAALLADERYVFLEVGPGRTLSSLIRARPESAGRVICTTLGQDDHPRAFLRAAGQLWSAGVSVGFEARVPPGGRQLIALPTYPFERKLHWVQPGPALGVNGGSEHGRPSTSLGVNGGSEHGRPSTSLGVNGGPEHGRPSTSLGVNGGSEHGRPSTSLGVNGGPAEQLVSSVFAMVLGIPPPSAGGDFFELGGNSLSATTLALKLREATRQPLPMGELLAARTVRGIAALIDGGAPAPTARVDLRSLTRLDEEIRAGALQPRGVLLTGATGFVGAFLLEELLATTPQPVRCLVRAPSEAKALERIEENLRRFGRNLTAEQRARILPVPGDLAAPRLGLTERAFEALARDTAQILHNGAEVNFVLPYDRLRPSNVDGTTELLRLCARGGAPLHHVSTIGALARSDGKLDFTERDLGAPELLETGYSQSKWVAEARVREAASRGLPVAIYRLGNVSGDSRTGICNTEDFISRAVTAWVQLGIAPDFDDLYDVTPVDFVSRALVHLALSGDALGRTVHLVNPHPLSLRALTAWMRETGYALELLPAPKFAAELASRVAKSQRSALHSMLGRLEGADAHRTHATYRYLCAETSALLAQTPIRCPEIGPELLAAYFQHLTRRGVLPSPTSPRS